MSGSLFAVSDLHVSYEENRSVIDHLQPEGNHDWLIVAGDVGEIFGDVEQTLRVLRDRFAAVIWVPGNHELWTHPSDPVILRGEERYRRLVQMCQDIGVTTPEDEYPVWSGESGPVTIAPLFLLYDYSFRAPGTITKYASLKAAYKSGVVCSDEVLLHSDPFSTREEWCWARLEETAERLDGLASDTATVLVSHWPLRREPTDVMWYPEFAQWCGTERTSDWHLRYRAKVAVYGHLHIPRSTKYDGVLFEEVSLGYPREWRRRGDTVAPMRRIVL